MNRMHWAEPALDYFSAVQEGRARVKAAVDLLQEVAGPSYPVLFLKTGHSEWTPVGDEIIFATVEGKGATAAVVLCDADGNAKAMSNWVPAPEAAKMAAQLEARGLPRYGGLVKLPI